MVKKTNISFLHSKRHLQHEKSKFNQVSFANLHLLVLHFPYDHVSGYYFYNQIVFQFQSNPIN